ncbi:conserved Plasmodium protein, unknown function [Plasmodium sp. gorilla clade G2]|uniref:conserved Plasmodium protein, unknown function n=1 Tax=Plasmodium sp. gorilla clade G2 TaxID=880535 RepID=UPI000D2076BB|nr:conserved Plasmodium protein, unknown function [Plasmodium sp. gorilla clade G2]SOV15940.1 conserved Plasmodium protein, unknown function [Plasmodium sp. gorilla clade G2]
MDYNGLVLKVEGNELLINQVNNEGTKRNFNLYLYKLKTKNDKLRYYEINNCITSENYVKGYINENSNMILLYDEQFYIYDNEKKKKSCLINLSDCEPVDFIYFKKHLIFIENKKISLFQAKQNGKSMVMLNLKDIPLKINFCSYKNLFYLCTSKRLYFLKLNYVKENKTLKVKNTNMSLPIKNINDQYAYHSYRNLFHKIDQHYKEVIHVCCYSDREVIIYKFVKGQYKNKKKCLHKLAIKEFNNDKIRGAFFFKVKLENKLKQQIRTTGYINDTTGNSNTNHNNNNKIDNIDNIHNIDNNNNNNHHNNSNIDQNTIDHNHLNETTDDEDIIKLYLLIYNQCGKVLIYFIDYLNEKYFKFGLTHIKNEFVVYMQLPFKPFYIYNTSDIFTKRVIKQKNIIQKKKKLSNNYNKYLEYILNKEVYVKNHFFLECVLVEEKYATIYTIQINHQFLSNLVEGQVLVCMDSKDSNHKMMAIKEKNENSDNNNENGNQSKLSQMLKESKFSCYSDSDSYIDSEITWTDSEEVSENLSFYTDTDSQVENGINKNENTKDNINDDKKINQNNKEDNHNNKMNSVELSLHTDTCLKSDEEESNVTTYLNNFKSSDIQKDDINKELDENITYVEECTNKENIDMMNKYDEHVSDIYNDEIISENNIKFSEDNSYINKEMCLPSKNINEEEVDDEVTHFEIGVESKLNLEENHINQVEENESNINSLQEHSDIYIKENNNNNISCNGYVDELNHKNIDNVNDTNNKLGNITEDDFNIYANKNTMGNMSEMEMNDSVPKDINMYYATQYKNSSDGSYNSSSSMQNENMNKSGYSHSRDENSDDMYYISDGDGEYYDLKKNMDDETEDEMNDETDDEVKDEVKDEIDDKIDDKIDDEIDDKVDDKMDEGIDDKMDEGIDDKMDEGIDDKMNEGIDDKMDEGIDDKIDDEIDEGIDKIKDEVKDKVDDKIDDKVDDKIDDKVKDEVKDKINDDINDEIKEYKSDMQELNCEIIHKELVQNENIEQINKKDNIKSDHDNSGYNDDNKNLEKKSKKKRKKEKESIEEVITTDHESSKNIREGKKIKIYEIENEAKQNVQRIETEKQNNNISKGKKDVDAIFSDLDMESSNNSTNDLNNTSGNKTKYNFTTMSSMIKLNISLKRYYNLINLINVKDYKLVKKTIANLGKKYCIKLLEFLLDALLINKYFMNRFYIWIKNICKQHKDVLKSKKYRKLITKISELANSNLENEEILNHVIDKINFTIDHIIKNQVFDNVEVLNYRDGTIIK